MGPTYMETFRGHLYLWTGTWVVTNMTHKKEIPRGTIFLDYIAFVIFSEI